MTTTTPSLLDLLDKAPATRAPLARWLLEHLVATGALTEDGIGRRARIHACRRCGVSVLIGLDDDMAAFEAICDPVPLTQLGEMLACIEGRRTYELRKAGGRWELDPRTAQRITFAPAESRQRVDVVRQHQCASRDLSEPETAVTSFAEVAATANALPADAEPPF